MKRSEPLWKRKLAKKMLAEQRMWNILTDKKTGWYGHDSFNAGSFYCPYIPLIKPGSYYI